MDSQPLRQLTTSTLNFSIFSGEISETFCDFSSNLTNENKITTAPSFDSVSSPKGFFK